LIKFDQFNNRRRSELRRDHRRRWSDRV